MPVVQQVSVELQLASPQHFLPWVLQKGFEPVVQQTWFFEQLVDHFALLPALACCAVAGLIPSVPRKPPARVPAISRSACRRGIGLARMRARSSRR